MAFLSVEFGDFTHLNTESMYLYQAYMMNITHTIIHSWLKNPTMKTIESKILKD